MTTGTKTEEGAARSVATPLRAEHARALMPQHAFENAVMKINGAIRAAAAKNQTQVRIDWLCTITGHSATLTPLGELVVNAYTKAGYTTREIYEERQFVDIGMALSWAEKAPTKK